MTLLPKNWLPAKLPPTPVPTAAKSTVQTLPNAWPICLSNADQRKSPFADRIKAQQAWLNLPLLPTTNIGSFPQTTEIRQARAAFKKGELSAADYEAAMKKEIALVVEEQEKLDLDVLVHGEAERNDMVEYFGELLSGFAFTHTAGYKATAHAA